jgi:uncharacterized membrane protein YeiH
MTGLLAVDALHPLQVPLWIDLAAVVVGALAGATTAVQERFDLVGGLTLAVFVGLGGGIVRDVLLGVRPVAVTDRAYLPTVAVAALVGFLFATLLGRFRRMLVLLDALSIGLFTVVGVEKALLYDLPPASAVFIGVAAAVGGGVLRDLIASRQVEVVRQGPWNATAALVGASVYAAMRGLEAPGVACEATAFAVVVVMRLASMRWGLHTPLPLDLSQAIAQSARAKPGRRWGRLGR